MIERPQLEETRLWLLALKTRNPAILARTEKAIDAGRAERAERERTLFLTLTAHGVDMRSANIVVHDATHATVTERPGVGHRSVVRR